MVKFTSLLPTYWKAHRERYEDNELNESLIDCIKTKIEPFFVENTNGSGNFLTGTKDLMMIDIHCFPLVDRLVILEGSPWNHVFELLDLKNNAPAMCEYVQLFRKHQVMAPHVMDPECYFRHLSR